MKSRLFNKYFFTTVFIIIFSIIFMLIILSVTLNRYFAKDKYITLSECCAKISDSIKKSPSNEIDTGLTSQMMNALSAVSGVDIFAVNNSGEIIACGCDEWMKNGECYHSDHTVPKSELVMKQAKNHSELTV